MYEPAKQTCFPHLIHQSIAQLFPSARWHDGDTFRLELEFLDLLGRTWGTRNPDESLQNHAKSIHTCMHAWMHTCMHSCIHTYIYAYNMYIYVYISMYIHILLNQFNTSTKTVSMCQRSVEFQLLTNKIIQHPFFCHVKKWFESNTCGRFLAVHTI